MRKSLRYLRTCPINSIAVTMPTLELGGAAVDLNPTEPVTFKRGRIRLVRGDTEAKQASNSNSSGGATRGRRGNAQRSRVQTDCSRRSSFPTDGARVHGRSTSPLDIATAHDSTVHV